LGGLTNLCWRTLWSVNVSDSAFSAVKGLKQLARLDISSIRTLGPSSIDCLSELLVLSDFRCYGTFESRALRSLAKLPRLRVASVGAPSIDDLLLDLSANKNVIELTLLRSHVTADTIKILRSMTSLTKLAINCCDLTPEAIQSVGKLNVHSIHCSFMDPEVVSGIAESFSIGRPHVSIIEQPKSESQR
jgi:hypothetical protein